MMVIVPSGVQRHPGFTRLAGALGGERRRDSRAALPSATAKDSPATPTMNLAARHGNASRSGLLSCSFILVMAQASLAARSIARTMR